MATNSSFMITILVVLATFLAVFVSANTECRNFEVGSLERVPRRQKNRVFSLLETNLLAQVSQLNATHNEKSFRIRPAALGTPLRHVCEVGSTEQDARRDAVLDNACPHELWLELDFDDERWTHNDKFTIRLSWPASYPTDFDISLFSPTEIIDYIRTRLDVKTDISYEVDSLGSRSTRPTKIHYARIRLVDTGIRLPLRSRSSLPNIYRGNPDDTVESVPFTIIVEPLLFSVVPETVVPFILFLIPVLSIIAIAHPYVMRSLQEVAVEARKELYSYTRPKDD